MGDFFFFEFCFGATTGALYSGIIPRVLGMGGGGTKFPFSWESNPVQSHAKQVSYLLFSIYEDKRRDSFLTTFPLSSSSTYHRTLPSLLPNAQDLAAAGLLKPSGQTEPEPGPLS